MLQYLTHGEFYRIAEIVEIVKWESHLLPKEDKQRIDSWIADCDDEWLNQFFLMVSTEWHDAYPRVRLEDHEQIAKIISECLKEV